MTSLPTRTSLRAALSVLVVSLPLAQLACGSAPAQPAPPPVASASAQPAAAQSTPAMTSQAPALTDPESITKALIEAASKGDFEGASARFNDGMKAALPPAKLAAVWQGVEEQFGKWQRTESTKLTTEHEHQTCRALSQFEKMEMVIKAVYDQDGKVTGLFFELPQAAWAAPSYADASKLEERNVTVGTSPALPGILTVPTGAGPFPAVVLVHGSGPNDEDESIGAVKVFKDLAWGLASQGVATLRYVKRSKASPAGIVTEKEEVVDAVHDAVALLKLTPSIDKTRVFVAGHSQGGYLGPRIAEGESGPKGIKGLILLAGSARPLQDSILDQFLYFSAQHPDVAQMKTAVESARAFKKTVEDPALRADQQVTLPTGGSITGAYFLYQRHYDPVATAKKLKCPILLLQGGRDYQVTDADLKLWQAGLAKKKTVTFQTFPSLNHLFVAGEGPPGPEEYALPGHVAEDVVNSVASFIKAAK